MLILSFSWDCIDRPFPCIRLYLPEVCLFFLDTDFFPAPLTGNFWPLHVSGTLLGPDVLSAFYYFIMIIVYWNVQGAKPPHLSLEAGFITQPISFITLHISSRHVNLLISCALIWSCYSFVHALSWTSCPSLLFRGLVVRYFVFLIGLYYESSLLESSGSQEATTKT